MPKIGVFPRDGWKVLGIGQLECVLYGVVCGMFYYVDNEKAMINKDDHQKHELHVELHRLVVETHLGHFWNFVFFNLCMPHKLFYAFYAFIYRTHNLMRLGIAFCLAQLSTQVMSLTPKKYCHVGIHIILGT